MKWEHRCSIEWLMIRQGCITATDIIKLIPYTKTGRKRTVTDEDRFKILANKFKTLNNDDTISVGAAARGHILEPYAIDAFNEHIKREALYHWDDAVVKNNKDRYGIAYSPDALSIQQDNASPILHISDTGRTLELGEVKCYSADKHIPMLYMEPDILEERWQIAVAMYCQADIQIGHLILFNPSIIDTKRRLGIHTYMRTDLQKEIEIIDEVYSNWITFIDKYASLKPTAVLTNMPIKYENEIYQEYIATNNHLDPI